MTQDKEHNALADRLESTKVSIDHDYWAEGLADGAQDCGLIMTPGQLTWMAEAMAGAHENYGMAFYSPPASDRLNETERDSERKLKALQAEFNRYQANAERAVRRALGTYSDTVVTIAEGGDVYRHGGRTEQIQ